MISSMIEPLVVEAAEKEIIPRYHHVEARIKKDGSLVTEADLAVQRHIETSLGEHWPEIPLLGEEMDPRAQSKAMESGRFWCLDPLDGTTNFSTGLPYFCVSLALIEHGRSVAGVTYDPIRRECFRADLGRGAFLNGAPLTLTSTRASLRESVALVDLKRLPSALVGRLAEAPPYRSQRNFGAIALEWCWLAAGRIDVYVHGSQKLWDYAAGSLVLGEAGGSALLLDSIGGASATGLTLVPRAAIAASNPRLLREWDGWLMDA